VPLNVSPSFAQDCRNKINVCFISMSERSNTREIMQINKYLYSFTYDNTETELSKLETRSIFNAEETNKLIFSDVKIEPSSSAFIKNRLEIILSSENYLSLIEAIKKEHIHVEDFKVEYLVMKGDTIEYSRRLEKLKDIGYSIEGNPDYYHPVITYALGNYKGIWLFGILNKDKFDWQKHQKKPFSYSNSININTAKALVNIAGNGKKEKTLLDACCGAGTIMLEACFAEKNIEGCDINWKLCKAARNNLAHFNYSAEIFRSDIKDISKRYDAAIVDLPYNLLSVATDKDIIHIVESTSAITDRLVIVSISDITNIIKNTKLSISDYCVVGKPGNVKFARRIWVCEKNNL